MLALSDSSSEDLVAAPGPVFVSIEVETTGPIPGVNAMLALALVSFDSSGRELGAHRVNLAVPKTAAWQPSTREWWDAPQRAKALAAVTEEPVDAAEAMEQVVFWLKGQRNHSSTNKLVGICWPSGLDYTFLRWYLIKYSGFGDAGDVFFYRVMDGHSCLWGTGLSDELGLHPRLRTLYVHFEVEPPEDYQNPLQKARAQGALFFALKRHKERSMQTAKEDAPTADSEDDEYARLTKSLAI